MEAAGAECGLASVAPGSPLLLRDYFFFFNLEFTDDKKRFLLDLTEPLTSTKSADADGVGSRVALGRQWGARSTAGLGHPAAPELGRVRSGPTGTQPAARSLLPCPR